MMSLEMKVIINTSIDPHFCFVFDEKNKLVDKHVWTERPKDGGEIFNFLQRSGFPEKNISFIGGISGPGGFSSLRTAASVINAIAFSQKIQAHQVRADYWISEFLAAQNYPSHNFVLNSFGDGVFWPEKSGEKNILQRVTVDEAAEKFIKIPVFIGTLPEKKQEKFKAKIVLMAEDLVEESGLLLALLMKQTPQAHFVPDYEFPAVQ